VRGERANLRLSRAGVAASRPLSLVGMLRTGRTNFDSLNSTLCFHVIAVACDFFQTAGPLVLLYDIHSPTATSGPRLT
jgi:hypothetical protein